MKKILGLDLGTNSIGWALIDYEEKKILGMGSRIIPMSQDILGEFEKGNSISQTAERTRLRSTRRLRERHLLRRERLHRVLNLLGFLPKHYADKIDFEVRVGKFLPEIETRLAYDDAGSFLFKESFEKMLADFRQHQPELLNRKNKKGENAKVPYDWTIYYLRKKALSERIGNEELAWLLLHFNQKRGYYQSRGEESDEKSNKLEEFYSLKVVAVTADDAQRGKAETWYNIILENGWIYRRASKLPLYDWKDRVRDFIVTTDINEDGSVKKDKEGKEKRSFRAPKEDDWKLLKKKSENEIEKSNKTVGAYVYDTLLRNPAQKIKGKLVRTIERKFYKDELKQILGKQIELNDSLKDKNLYMKCIDELYPHNLNHQSTLLGKDFAYLFVEDISFYQRSLRSQKGTVGSCPLEYRTYMHEGIQKKEPLKCIPKSHPLYQEFRLWQWIGNVRIFSRDNDDNETGRFFSSVDDIAELFHFLNERKEVNQDSLLRYLVEKNGVKGKELKNEISKYRWNYVDDKEKKYPCNETHAMIKSRLEKVHNLTSGFLTKEKEEALWHIIYSVTDKIDYEKALKTFAEKNNLDGESFYEAFKKFPPFPSDYGAYSAKTIGKLLPLMRIGSYWSWDNIDLKTKARINNLLTGEFDEKIKDSVREKAIHLTEESDFQGLPEWLAKYVVYDRHSEKGEAGKWKMLEDIENCLKEFKQHSLHNPIVEQVIAETLRVVKDIWQYYGKGVENFFDQIHIELSREMKNPAAERKRLSEQITKNENTNLRIKVLLDEMLKDKNVEKVRPYSPMQQDILKIYEDGVLNSDIEIPEDIEKISKLAQPTSSELQRYKLWLEQKYRSPYTGEIIPLNKLFTPAYEIEHIIPQQRYYDDSFSNKVICESAVNKLKDNQTGLEFIRNHYGQTVELGLGKTARVFTEEEYAEFIKQHYAKNRQKKSKLMALDIPEKMIERQLNDTRYISKFIMQALSNMVREDKDDEGMNSKNVLAINAQITGKLKQDWGLDAIWNELVLPRFERMNALTNSNHFTVYNERHQKFLPAVPLELKKGFSKKRIDHRHHALDALVIACATRNHINYLNNRNALDKKKSKDQKQKERYDLKVVLCDKKFTGGSSDNYEWVFKQPWLDFVPKAKEALEKIVVSFKQNLRVINKTTNYYEAIKDGKKEKVKQTKGQSWAIRKPLHKDTVSGLVSIGWEKPATLAVALENWQIIANKNLKNEVGEMLSNGQSLSEILYHFRQKKYIFEGEDISKVKLLLTASRESLDTSFNKSRIESITDTGIQKILLNHLGRNGDNPEAAFSPEGIEEMNKNIVELNGGRPRQPILKVRTYETKGKKFEVGQVGNKKYKLVESAKGTNLFFAVYQDENGKRSFETVPLNEVIEHQKWRASLSKELRKNTTLIPIKVEKGKFLFSLSPGDLVYIPSEEEREHTYRIDFNNLSKEQIERIWAVNDFSSAIYFTPNSFSRAIAPKEIDLCRDKKTNKLKGSFDSKTASFNGTQIKDYCIKLSINRLGKIIYPADRS